MFKRKILAIALAVSSVFSVSSAFAGSTTGTMLSSATLTSACTLTTSGLAFGSVSGISTLTTANTPMSITCSKGTSYTVSADNGSFAGSSSAARYMQNSGYSSNSGGPTLGWMLYRDSALTVVFGQKYGGNVDGTFTSTGTGLAQVTTLYGQILANQTVAPGSYYDNISITVTY